MIDENYLRQWARRCHSLSQVTADPEVRYLLESWAMEFDRDADDLGRPRPRKPDVPAVPK